MKIVKGFDPITPIQGIEERLIHCYKDHFLDSILGTYERLIFEKKIEEDIKK